MTRIPLDLYAEVETASGTRYRWDANQAPGSRLRNFSFRTKIGEGFSDANGQLARRIDQDYPDLNLVNTVTLVGADGSVAYEGRMSAMPRELSDTHSIGVTLTGWMAHAKDRKFSEIYVDRDLSHWQGPNSTRRVNIAANPSALGSSEVVPDAATRLASLMLRFEGAWAATAGTRAEAYYDTGGVGVGRVFFDAVINALAGTGGSWGYAFITTDDQVTFDSAMTFTPPVATAIDFANQRRYLLAQFFFATGPTGADSTPYELFLRQLAVYGRHGLTYRAYAANEPWGFYASDVLRDIATRFCPQLDVSGVQDTSYVIPHIAFRDRTFPYDAFLELNKYHLWHLGVWENKRLDFRPYDLSDYDWEIRTDDPGTTFSPQGPSTEDLFNGIAVTYTDILTGTTNTITPDDNATLSDTSSTNPWNQHGIDHWDEIALSTPTLEAAAVQLGAAALADRNRAKTPGTITARGYIRDRAGNEQPVWKVRAGDTISVTNFPNDTPRLVVETDYNDEDKSVRLAIDRPFQLLEAYLDRQQNALQAQGLA